MDEPRCGTGVCILILTGIAATSSIVKRTGLTAETAQELRISVRCKPKNFRSQNSQREFTRSATSLVERDCSLRVRVPAPVQPIPSSPTVPAPSLLW